MVLMMVDYRSRTAEAAFTCPPKGALTGGRPQDVPEASTGAQEELLFKQADVHKMNN